MRRGAGRSARPASGGPNAEREPSAWTPQECVRRPRRVPLRSAATRRPARNLIMGDAYLVGIPSRPPRGDESDERAIRYRKTATRDRECRIRRHAGLRTEELAG